MTNRALATSYLVKARKRLLVLELLLREDAYSDVVREAQELVELALKGLLRHAAIEPPKWHDVGGAVRKFHARFPSITLSELEQIVAASAWLRKEREAALYGDIDFIPTEQYGIPDAQRAIADAKLVLDVVTRAIAQSGDTQS